MNGDGSADDAMALSEDEDERDRDAAAGMEDGAERRRAADRELPPLRRHCMLMGRVCSWDANRVDTMKVNRI